MRDVTTSNFGLLIAYVIPGFVALWGVGCFSPTVEAWLSGTTASGPTVSGFLYLTLASVFAGLIVSTVRWLIIDAIHHRTGIPPREWDYAPLAENIAAFQFMVSNQYRYYQFYSNSVVAVAFSFAVFAVARGLPPAWIWGSVLACETVLWLGSRDTLKNYYSRVGAILSKGEHSKTAITPRELASPAATPNQEHPKVLLKINS